MAELPDSDGSQGEDDIATRHRKEIKELRAKIQALKKSVSKGDKKKKKEVSIEIAKLEEEIKTRQQKEPATELSKDVGNPSSNDGNHSNEGVVPLTDQVEELSVPSSATTEREDKPVRKSKAQKQREKKQRREQEREKRIAEGTMAEDNTKRYEERTKLLTILQPLGLVIKDIRPDGNCLYTAVGDQLKLIYDRQVSVQELRQQCGDYIEGHCDYFMPFITNHETGDSCTPDYFSSYCHNIKFTAEWGGEVELVALSHVHHMPITVYQSEAPPIVIGNEDYSNEKMIYISYHQHEFSLGKHYNSIIPKMYSTNE